jgi:uncharacterized protein YegJ (DUF2314 family)
MKYNELTKWAGSKGYHVYKYEDTVKWMWQQNGLIEGSGTVQSVATQIFNHISDYRWVSYQEEYAREKANRDIHLEPLK